MKKRLKEVKHAKIFSKLDLDGILSTAILIKTLERENIPFSVSFVDKLNEYILNQKDLILIGLEAFGDYIYLKNPRETYNLAIEFNNNNKDLLYLVLISNNNKDLINEAVPNQAEYRTGLTCFESCTEEIHRLLEFSIDPFNLEISGSEENAINFLKKNNIPLKVNGQFRRIIDLTKDEENKLLKLSHKENNFGEQILIKYGDKLIDRKEIISYIDTCIKTKQPSLSIGFCLKNKIYKIRAKNLLNYHKNNIINNLKWIYSNHQEMDEYVIIKCDSYIEEISKILFNSKRFNEKPIICVATEKDQISLYSEKIDLKQILQSNENILNRSSNMVIYNLPENQEEFIQKCKDSIKQLIVKEIIK